MRGAASRRAPVAASPGKLGSWPVVMPAAIRARLTSDGLRQRRSSRRGRRCARPRTRCACPAPRRPGSPPPRSSAQIDDYLVPGCAGWTDRSSRSSAGPPAPASRRSVNSLVRAPICPAGVLRPTTRAPLLVGHPVDTAWFRRALAPAPPGPGDPGPDGGAGRTTATDPAAHRQRAAADARARAHRRARHRLGRGGQPRPWPGSCSPPPTSGSS